MISVTVTGATEADILFEELPSELRDALATRLAAFTGQLWDKIVNEKLSGQALQMRSGRLARSIRSETTDDGETLEGIVFSDGSAPYARILEYGGRTRPHDILPVRAKALHFMASGGEVFARIVHHPGSTIAEHSFMRSALRELMPELGPGFQEAIATRIAALQEAA